MPPVGFTTVFLTGNATASSVGLAARGAVSHPTPAQLSALTISNGVLSLEFNKTTGGLHAVTVDGDRVVVEQEFMAYDSETDWPDSTAYIFRPTYTELAYPVLFNTTRSAPDLVYINGPLVQEVIQTYNPTYNASYFVQQSLRLFSDPAAAAGGDGIDVRAFIDSFMVLGLNHTNKELITRFTTNLANHIPPPTSDAEPKQPRVTFYTDANGVGIKQRQVNHPFWEKYTPNAFWYEPVAVNYYPAATASFIRDESGDSPMQLSVMTDRAHGAGCLGSGQLEIMLHRRNSVSGTISLDDTSVIHTHQALSVASSPSDASLAHRALSRRVTNEVQVYYGITASAPKASSARKHGSTMTQQELVTAQWTAAYAANMSFVRQSLPANVALQSLDVVLGEPNQLLLRLRHLFAAHENPVLSQAVTVDLVGLLNPALLTVTNVQAMTLNANAEVKAPSHLVDPVRGFQTSVTLQPLETKTFVVTVAAA